MSPLKFTENPLEKAILLRGSPSWYCFKFVKYLLILVCLMILLLINQFSVINDNFTKAYKDDSSKNKSALNESQPTSLPVVSEKLSITKLTLGNLNTKNETISRVKRDSKHDHDHSNVNLTDLLIMYPCCTTMVIILGMEMLGQALKDPLHKTTNLILIFLCIILSVTVLIVSMMASIRKAQATMITLTIVAIIFSVFEVADLILLLLS